MLSIVNGEPLSSDDQLRYLPGTPLEPQANDFAQGYSTLLLALIRECLRWDPRDRITVERLQEHIEDFLYKTGPFRTFALNARAGHQLPGPYDVVCNQERYRIGFAIEGPLRHQLEIPEANRWR